MNEQTYRKYGSSKRQRVIISAQTVTTDVLQFVRRLEGDYEINGNFQVTKDLSVFENFYWKNENADLVCNADLYTANGYISLEASEHVQLSGTTNLFSPNAIHFTDHDKFASSGNVSSEGYAISLLSRKNEQQDLNLPFLVFTDACLQPSNPNVNENVDLISTPSSMKSSLAIETKNPFSQLHCLYTGTDFRAKSILSDAVNANIRIAAEVDSANTSSLLFETSSFQSMVNAPLAKIKYMNNTTTPDMPGGWYSDDWTTTNVPLSTRKYLIASMENDPYFSSAYLFASGPLLAGFDAQRTHLKVPYSYPSIVSRNKLEIINSKENNAINATLKLTKGVVAENELQLANQLFQLDSPAVISTGSFSLHSTTHLLECYRYQDFHRKVNNLVSFPASFTVSSDGRTFQVGRNARSLEWKGLEKNNDVFQSMGSSSFQRSGARVFLRHRLKTSDSDELSMQQLLLPSESSLLPHPSRTSALYSPSITRNRFFGNHVACLFEKPSMYRQDTFNNRFYRHPLHLRFNKTWMKCNTLFDGYFEGETLTTSPSVMLILPYRSDILFENQWPDTPSQFALIVGHLSNVQLLLCVNSISSLLQPSTVNTVKIEPAAGTTLFDVRNDINICSLNLETSLSFFRTVSFAKRRQYKGFVALQIYQFDTMEMQLKNYEGLWADDNLVPETIENEHKLMTFPWRETPILQKDATNDYFVCSFYDANSTLTNVSEKLSFRLLQFVYSYTPDYKKWIVHLRCISESFESSIEVPQEVKQQVADRLQIDLATHPSFRVPLYTPDCTLSSGISNAQPGGGITYSFFDPETKVLVLCVDSVWATLVDFNTEDASKNILRQSMILPLGSSSPLYGEFRECVLQPIKVWKSRDKRYSVLFLNIAAIHFNTCVQTVSGVVASCPKENMAERINRLLGERIPVFVRWDIDETGSIHNVVKLMLKSDVDFDGEWTRLLQDLSVTIYNVDQLSEDAIPPFGQMGMIHTTSSQYVYGTSQEDMQKRRNPSCFQVSGDLLVEVFGMGQLSFDLQSFYSFQDGKAPAAIRVHTGDVQLHGSSRLIGCNSEKMQIMPSRPDVPLELGYNGELTVEPWKMKVASYIVVTSSSYLRGPSLEQMEYQRKLEAAFGVQLAPGSNQSEIQTWTDERLYIGGDEMRPLTLNLCIDDTGIVNMGDTFARNIRIEDRLKTKLVHGIVDPDNDPSYQQLLFTGTMEKPLKLRLCPDRDQGYIVGGKLILMELEVIDHVTLFTTTKTNDLKVRKHTQTDTCTALTNVSTGFIHGKPENGFQQIEEGNDATPIASTKQLLSIEGIKDEQPLMLKLCRNDTGTIEMGDTVARNMSIEETIHVSTIFGHKLQEDDVFQTVKIQGKPSSPMALYLGRNPGDVVYIGETSSSENTSTLINTEKLKVMNTLTELDANGLHLVGDLECDGSSVSLGNGSSSASITLNAPTTTFYNSNIANHGYIIDDGLMVQW